MREYRRVTACPICGGKLVVQEFYTFTREYAVTKKGLLSNRYTVSDGGPIDCINAYCSRCGKVWGADEVCVESSGEVFIKMEAEENHVSD